MNTATTTCPECHGRPDLLLVKIDRLVKKCTECNHRWNEAREGLAQASKNNLPREAWKTREMGERVFR